MRMRRIVGLLVGAAVLVSVGTAHAGSPLHPDVLLLDAEGGRYSSRGSRSRPRGPAASVTTPRTSRVTAITSPSASTRCSSRASVASARPWSFSPGMFGRWDALRYRRLTIPGEAPFDLGVADWIRTFGDRHVGGGPAYYDARGSSPRGAFGRRRGGPRDARPRPRDRGARGLGLAGFRRRGDELLPLPPPRPGRSGPDRHAEARALRLGRHGDAREHRPRRTGRGRHVELRPLGVRGRRPGRPRSPAPRRPRERRTAGSAMARSHFGKEPVQLPTRPEALGDGVEGADLLAADRRRLRHESREQGIAHTPLGRPRRAPARVHQLPPLAEQPGLLLRGGALASRGTWRTTPGASRSATTSPSRTTTSPRASRRRGTSRDDSTARCGAARTATPRRRCTAIGCPNTRRHLETLLCESCHIPSVAAPARQHVRLDGSDARAGAARRVPRSGGRCRRPGHPLLGLRAGDPAAAPERRARSPRTAQPVHGVLLGRRAARAARPPGPPRAAPSFRRTAPMRRRSSPRSTRTVTAPSRRTNFASTPRKR